MDEAKNQQSHAISGHSQSHSLNSLPKYQMIKTILNANCQVHNWAEIFTDEFISRWKKYNLSWKFNIFRGKTYIFRERNFLQVFITYGNSLTRKFLIALYIALWKHNILQCRINYGNCLILYKKISFKLQIQKLLQIFSNSNKPCTEIVFPSSRFINIK